METLQQLNTYKANDFESWLDRCLRQQYSNNPETRYRACDFRGLGVSFGESHTDSIQMLFKKLSAPAQEAFREGICLLISRAKPGDFPKEAMSDLILLVCLVKATQALPLFMPLFGEGDWGKKHRPLIYDCASVMLSFGRQDESEMLYQKLIECAQAAR